MAKQIPVRDFSSVLNLVQTIKDRLNKFDAREEFYKKKFKQIHKEFSEEVFKVRNTQYFQHERIKKYKTPHLLLREVHRALRGLISNAQKQRDRENIKKGGQKEEVVQVFNDIKNYPDNTLLIKTDMIIENVTKMGEEEKKYANDADFFKYN